MGVRLYRRGSRINTDWFPKRAPKAQAFSGVRGLAPPRNYLDFYSLKSPFLGFRVIQMGYWPDFNLESVFIFKNIFNMKSVTDFRKTVETGVDPHLQYRIKAPSFNVSKERIHLFLSATGRGECNGPCHARKASAPVAPPLLTGLKVRSYWPRVFS